MPEESVKHVRKGVKPKESKEDKIIGSASSESIHSSKSNKTDSSANKTENSKASNSCPRSLKKTTFKLLSREKLENRLSKHEAEKGSEVSKKNELAFSDTKRRLRRRQYITICLSKCRYEIVREVARKHALLEVPEDTVLWNIYWTDYSISLERAMDLKPFQIVNHFPGMNEICRKDLLARNLNRMRRTFPQDYKFFPRSWCLPADNAELVAYASSRRGRAYICKPEVGCQGKGIFLVRNVRDLNPYGRMICQVYIHRPFLIDDLKFDLRIYVLITSCDPLRIYIYKEGLARFATAKYKCPTNNNQDNSFMHLTNYAVNKFSEDFIIDDKAGSKRRLSTVIDWLQKRNYNTEKLLSDIDDAIIKTIFSALPSLKHNYQSCFPQHCNFSACFEILGFDILLDHELHPYVIEVNHSPSFHTDSKLDYEIKEALLTNTFSMLNVRSLDRRKIEALERKRIHDRLVQRTTDYLANERLGTSLNSKKLIRTKSPRELDPSTLVGHDAKFKWEIDHVGGFRLVYPLPHTDMYDRFFSQNNYSLYMETAASQARAQMTKLMLEENNYKVQQDKKKRAQQWGVKSKLRPESPDEAKKSNGEKRKKLKVLNWRENLKIRPFEMNPIISEEESNRVKALIQRGMLIKRLGVDVQCYDLLCSIGHLKPKDHDNFKFRSSNSTLPYPQECKVIFARIEAPASPSSRQTPINSESTYQVGFEGTNKNTKKVITPKSIRQELYKTDLQVNSTMKNIEHLETHIVSWPPTSVNFENSLFARRWQADKGSKFSLPRIP